jgi:hypothetical protein
MESPKYRRQNGAAKAPVVPAGYTARLAGSQVIGLRVLQERRCAGIWGANLLHSMGRNTMSGFDDREKAFESKFALDADMQFRAEARRNKLVGLWAAGLLGKSGDDAAAYAITVVQADFEESGVEDVVRKVAADLAGHATADDIRAKLAELLPVAKAQLMDEV